MRCTWSVDRCTVLGVYERGADEAGVDFGLAGRREASSGLAEERGWPLDRRLGT